MISIFFLFVLFFQQRTPVFCHRTLVLPMTPQVRHVFLRHYSFTPIRIKYTWGIHTACLGSPYGLYLLMLAAGPLFSYEGGDMHYHDLLPGYPPVLCLSLSNRFIHWKQSYHYAKFVVADRTAVTTKLASWRLSIFSVSRQSATAQISEQKHRTVTEIEWCELSHWGRVTHICVGNLTIIGSDNGLSPGRRQAII